MSILGWSPRRLVGPNKVPLRLGEVPEMAKLSMVSHEEKKYASNLIHQELARAIPISIFKGKALSADVDQSGKVLWNNASEHLEYIRMFGLLKDEFLELKPDENTVATIDWMPDNPSFAFGEVKTDSGRAKLKVLKQKEGVAQPFLSEREWFENGRRYKYKEDEFFKSGRLKKQTFFNESGQVHRTDGPAEIRYFDVDGDFSRRVESFFYIENGRFVTSDTNDKPYSESFWNAEGDLENRMKIRTYMHSDNSMFEEVYDDIDGSLRDRYAFGRERKQKALYPSLVAYIAPYFPEPIRTRNPKDRKRKISPYLEPKSELQL